MVMQGSRSLAVAQRKSHTRLLRPRVRIQAGPPGRPCDPAHAARRALESRSRPVDTRAMCARSLVRLLIASLLLGAATGCFVGEEIDKAAALNNGSGAVAPAAAKPAIGEGGSSETRGRRDRRGEARGAGWQELVGDRPLPHFGRERRGHHALRTRGPLRVHAARRLPRARRRPEVAAARPARRNRDECVRLRVPRTKDGTRIVTGKHLAASRRRRAARARVGFGARRRERRRAPHDRRRRPSRRPALAALSGLPDHPARALRAARVRADLARRRAAERAGERRDRGAAAGGRKWPRRARLRRRAARPAGAATRRARRLLARGPRALRRRAQRRGAATHLRSAHRQGEPEEPALRLRHRPEEVRPRRARPRGGGARADPRGRRAGRAGLHAEPLARRAARALPAARERHCRWVPS